MVEVLPRFVPPYSKVAETYDIGLGISFFMHTRMAFEKLVRRYGITFCSAADIGCGTGLFARYLSQCWRVPVFAVDRSPAMLQVAQRNCRDPNICFLQQDIRQLCLPHPVDLITANFDTMNHLLTAGDLKAAFQRIYANLRPGGHFIFDLLTPRQPSYIARGITIRLRAKAGGEFLQQIRWFPWQRLLSILAILRLPSSVSPKVEVHKERLYSPEAACRWLQEVGFMIRGVHDAMTLRTARECPPRVIIIAKQSHCFESCDWKSQFRKGMEYVHPS